MYPSIVFLPIPMIGFRLLKSWKGPHETLKISADLAEIIISFTQKYIQSEEYTPESLHTELAIVHHLMPKSLNNCFDLSCAFQQWLALHGVHSEVVVGKRVTADKLVMHAWVETENAVFFKETEFERINWVFSG